VSLIPNGVTLILAVPAATAAVLAFMPDYRLSARLNVVSSFVTLLAAISLFVRAPAPGPYILVDDLNIVFIVLSSFVGFTTGVFSASYIAHELEIGRLKPTHLRFYHAMYQILLFAMNLCGEQHRPNVGRDRALVGGLLIGFGALMLRLQGLAFGEPAGSTAPVEASYVPTAMHLGLVLMAGIYLPPPLVTWFQHVAGLLG
jgi:hypothetical protein